MTRTIVIGDTHGCLDELDELLALVSFKPGADALYLTGDLLDRGPDCAGVVRRVRELGAQMVLGNHEEKYLRWRRYEKIRAATGAKNPMRDRTTAWLAIHDSLREEDWAWLESLPWWLDLGGRWRLVHAGCQPGIPVAAQRADVLCMARYLRRADGKMVKLGDELRPDTHAYWTEVWTGPESIIYGHHPTNKVTPVVDEPQPGVQCVCVDTGCCFGGSLSAAILVEDKLEFASVRARQVYCDRADR